MSFMLWVHIANVGYGGNVSHDREVARSHGHNDDGLFLPFLAIDDVFSQIYFPDTIFSLISFSVFDTCRLRVPLPSESDTTRPTLLAVDVERCLITFKSQLAHLADTLLPRSESTATRRPEADALLELDACVT